MKTQDRRSSRRAESRCRSAKDIQVVQPFPSGGLLGENLNLSLPQIADRIGTVESEAHSYVVSTVNWNHETTTFEQHGSAPNFQGGVLTLCTCKHQMRTRRAIGDWKGVWLAGVTSRRIHGGKHWLFYLAQIKSAYESHADLWVAMKAGARTAKAAHLNYLGDIYRPKSPPPTADDRFSPGRYVSPRIHIHRWKGEDGWHEPWRNDINYKHAPRSGHPPLLVADPRRTFLWDEPMIYFVGDHNRDYVRWASLRELSARLRRSGP